MRGRGRIRDSYEICVLGGQRWRACGWNVAHITKNASIRKLQSRSATLASQVQLHNLFTHCRGGTIGSHDNTLSANTARLQHLHQPPCSRLHTLEMIAYHLTILQSPCLLPALDLRALQSGGRRLFELK